MLDILKDVEVNWIERKKKRSELVQVSIPILDPPAFVFLLQTSVAYVK